jgi:hypothetical protein
MGAVAAADVVGAAEVNFVYKSVIGIGCLEKVKINQMTQ